MAVFQPNAMITAKHIKKSAGIFFIIVLLIPSILSGCSGYRSGSMPKQMGTEEKQKEDTIPEQLKGLETSIEKIIKTFNGPAVMPEEGKKNKEAQGDGEQQTGSKGSQSQGSQDSGTQSGQGSQDGQGNTSGQGQQGQQPKKPTPWEEITPTINTMHFTWNTYMPMAVKRGASKKLIEGFSTALNSLTSTIIGKNETNTLMAANYLYASIPDFYSLYRTKTSPEIKRMRYLTRNAMLNATTANWKQTDTDITNLMGTWTLYKTALTQTDQEAAGKLDFSVYELQNVIKGRNQPLIDIKGRIVLSNIQVIEKSVSGEKDSSGEGGASGSGGSGGDGGDDGSGQSG